MQRTIARDKDLSSPDLSNQNLSFGWIVASTSLAFVIASLDVSIVNIALPQIAQAYKATISTLQWVIDAYTLAFAVLLLSAGSISDKFGARRVFQTGILIFCIASIGCGLAPTPAILILFRVLQGLGAATMIPSSLAVLNQSFAHDPAKRARAVALWTAGGSIGIASGPIVGGLIIHISSWHYIFYINAPLCLIGMLLTLKLPRHLSSLSNKGFDIPGQITWMLFITTITAAIIEEPKLGITHPLIYGGLIFSVLMFVLFLAIERRAQSPMLPLHLFDFAPFNVLLLLGATFNAAYYGTIFVLSIYLQNVLHYSTLMAGLAFIPLSAGFTISNLVCARIINKYGLRVPILIGLTMFAAGFAGLFIAGEHTAYWMLFFPFMIIPLGMGLAVPAMTTGVLSSVDKLLSGTASGALNTVRQAAGAIGVAVIGSIASNGNRSILQAIDSSATFTLILTTIVFGLCFKYLRLTDKDLPTHHR